MIGRVRGRRSFAALREHGRRSRAGPLLLTYRPVDAPDALRCLAIAVGRPVGSAPVRNRVRRRTREAFRSIVAAAPGSVPPGDYLIAVRRADAGVDELATWLSTALRALDTSSQ